MKTGRLVVFAVALLGWAGVALGADQADPAVVAAADRFLSTIPADWHQIEPGAAQQLIESAQPFVLDVREPAELTSVIPGSVHVPLRQLAKQLDKLPANRAAPILTYCKVGYRGGLAMSALRMLGYTNVRTVKGGFDAWEKAGLAVARGPAPEKK